MSTLQRIVRTRRACPEVGWGRCEVLETGETSVLALQYEWQGEIVLILHNLADDAVEVQVSLEGIGRLRPLFCDQDDRIMRDASDPISLNAYGYRWFRAQGERR
jgi:maltose alpha-D-glucosyltransferase / alpha-amylase